MKIAIGVIILSMFVFLVAIPAISSNFEDRIVVTDASESAPANPDSKDQDTSETYPILTATSFFSTSSGS
ncbi:MAG: hypothetical protein HKO91_04260 [Desulfobacterales bacterium]|nr:hypothetical protein [Desulfobacterales bacterium]